MQPNLHGQRGADRFSTSRVEDASFALKYVKSIRRTKASFHASRYNRAKSGGKQKRNSPRSGGFGASAMGVCSHVRQNEENNIGSALKTWHTGPDKPPPFPDM
jgi:hypothetical protein